MKKIELNETFGGITDQTENKKNFNPSKYSRKIKRLGAEPIRLKIKKTSYPPDIGAYGGRKVRVMVRARATATVTRFI